MRAYARPGWRMAGQLGGDLLLLAWIAAWAWVGRALAHQVARLAEPAQRSAEAAREMSDQMAQAGDQVASVPMAGDQLSQPFQRLSGGLHQLVDQANQQAASIVTLSHWAGWVVFLVPSLVALLWWLPRRIRFIRLAAAARTLVDADEDLQLFALRAMANVPMRDIARVTPDPVGEWRCGNQEVIGRLAELELNRIGLSRPRKLRG